MAKPPSPYKRKVSAGELEEFVRKKGRSFAPR